MFKVAARNKIGLGAYTDAFQIVAATVPNQPSAPSTSVNDLETYISISWSLPSQTGGVSISGYRIYIETSSGSWSQEPINCDGINDFAVISQRSCSIPVDILRATPFNLTTGKSIRAKVIAFNVIGDSIESQIGSGGLMPIPPYVPTAPINLSRNNA